MAARKGEKAHELLPLNVEQSFDSSSANARFLLGHDNKAQKII